MLYLRKVAFIEENFFLTYCWDLSSLKWSESRSVISYSLRPHGLYSPWNAPGQNTGKGSHSLLQWIFPTQGSNPGLPHCNCILYQLRYQESRRSEACSLFFFFSFFFFIVVGFVIHWNESAMGLHVVPIPIPPPTFPLSGRPDPSRSSQCTRSERLSHRSM